LLTKKVIEAAIFLDFEKVFSFRTLKE